LFYKTKEQELFDLAEELRLQKNVDVETIRSELNYTIEDLKKENERLVSEVKELKIALSDKMMDFQKLDDVNTNLKEKIKAKDELRRESD